MQVAQILLDLQCLQISVGKPFSYASGLKGPIYCDNRKILSHVSEREKIIDYFVELIKSSQVEFDAVAGLATAGIPHAALIAHQLKKPMIYVRSKAKEHGKGNQVEGQYSKGDRIILIEDLVNQGASLEAALVGINECGLKAKACYCIVDYEMKKSKERLKNANLPLFSLTNFSSISKLALDKEIISSKDYQDLFNWQKAPEDWVSP